MCAYEVEYVHALLSAACPASLEALLSVLVVELLLLRVAEHLVGFADLLELLRVASLVGMVLHGRLAEGLLDVGVARVLGTAQQLVVLAVVDRLLAPASATTAAAAAAAASTAAAATVRVRVRHAAREAARPAERKIEHRSTGQRQAKGTVTKGDRRLGKMRK